MAFGLGQIIVWIALGLLVGSLAGLLLRRKKEGFGTWGNLGIGLVGAVVGGFFSRLMGLDLGLAELSISLEDIVSGLIGAFLFVGFLSILKQRKVQNKK